MSKVKWLYIGLSVLFGVVVIGAGVVSYFIASDKNEGLIKVAVKEGESDTVEFKKLCLLPGETCAYTVRFDSEVPERYELMLTFRENRDKCLKDYVYARIEANGAVVCEEKLSKLFKDDGISLQVDFAQDMNTDIKIVYFIPEWVENEAQNTETAFTLTVSASNRGKGNG